ncbi:MAG: PLP-dependent aminotransferase family protein [Solirubrobacteraceae bacterium]
MSNSAPRQRRDVAQQHRYEDLFARRMDGMSSAAMRDLMALTAREDVISFAGGLPDTSGFAPGYFTELMDGVARQAVARALQYGPTEGLLDVREAIARVMAAEGMELDPDLILPTSGGQQALDLITKILVDPGDVIIAEAPTYPGAVPTFGSYEADVIQIAMDNDGMRIDLLREVLGRLDSEGRQPKFIYTIPNFHNPAGVTMSLERRRELLQIARERGLVVVEDNPYGLLRYEGDPIPPLYTLDDESVVYVGTFSKILAPGLRIGWLAAPAPVLAKLVLGKGAADLCSSTVSQFFIAQYFQAENWLQYVQHLATTYRKRRDVMLAALSEHFPPEATWTHPRGGLFLWATLPDYIDTTELLAQAIKQRVAFVPGRAAYADGRGGSEMRLNFSAADEDEIREGVRRLGAVIRDQISRHATSALHDPDRSDHSAAGSADPAAEKRSAHTPGPTPAASPGRF